MIIRATIPYRTARIVPRRGSEPRVPATATPPNFDDPAVWDALRRTLDQSFVILEHRHRAGSRAPTVLVFDDYDELVAYIRANARPGDALWTWRYDALCRDDNSLVHGRMPLSDGTVPTGGAY